MHLKDFPIATLVGCRVVNEPTISENLRPPLSPQLFTGIEIEAEGVEVHRNASRYDSYQVARHAGWKMEGDGSLRSDGVEFVLEEPMNGQRLSAAVETLMDLYEGDRITWHGSPRAGTHFHLNVSNKNFGFLQGMAALMFCVDELLFKYAGEDRKWCSYCNSLNTLPFSVLRALLGQTGEVDEESMGWHRLWPMSDGDRYYGFNITSVSKYGTVELRYFRTPESKEELWEWLDLCHTLYQVAEEFENEEHPAQAVAEAMLSRPTEILQKLRFLDTSEDAVTSVLEAAEELSHIIMAETVSGDEDIEATPQYISFWRSWHDNSVLPAPDIVREDRSEEDDPDINTLAS